MSDWINDGGILVSVFARLNEKGKFTVKDLKHELYLQLNFEMDCKVFDSDDVLTSSEIHEKVNKAVAIVLNDDGKTCGKT